MALFRRFANKKPKLKKSVTANQHHHLLSVQGELGDPSYEVLALVFSLRDGKETVTFNNECTNHQFRFQLDLKEKANLFIHNEVVYNTFLKVRVKESHLTKNQLNLLKTKESTSINKETKEVEYLIRLGRFKETHFPNRSRAIIGENTFELYVTVKGNLALAINSEFEQAKPIQVDYFHFKKGQMNFGGKLFTRSFQIDEMNVIMQGRDHNIYVKRPIAYTHLTEETKRKFGLNRYLYDISLNLAEMLAYEGIVDDVYDVYLQLTYKNSAETELIRLGKPRFRVRYFLKSGTGKKDDKIFSFVPYFTFRASNLAIQVNEFAAADYRYLKNVMRWSFIHRLINKPKDIWLVGERSAKGQDTGYHFFVYMRKQHPNRNVYYVIEKDSAEAKNVEPYGNVVYFGSKEHMKYTLIATRIIGSHHPDYLYPTRAREFKRKVKAKKVFLQHGIMGTKNMIANYGKTASDFDTDLFIVSSEMEKEMIVHDFGYDREEVKVTGLSRFDRLFDGKTSVKRQLLIMPTWREWLTHEADFLESEYYARYHELIYSEELQRLAKEYDFDILFYFHVNMQKYSHHFESAPVRIVTQDEINVQDLLKESAMMITDYSSVAFDFSFLEKPVIYYQFDRRRFIGARGSHLDLDNELPGDIVYELTDIVKLTEAYARTNFQMKKELKQRANRFVKYKDQQSRERIYNEVKNFDVPNSPFKRIKHTELYRAIFKIYRRSKYYMPSMKLFYRIAKRILPVDENLILFESGIGKQYADSPKYIYEKMLEQGTNYQIIWVYNKNLPIRHASTKRILRLSPQYFYYLAKAKIWVNNQNFPAYIRKRPKTTYLQTWHGTPLKRMLFDIENVVGRTDGYIERVSGAIKNWDYLISPSEYATNAFRSAFRYKGKMLEVGYPRNDIFYRDDKVIIEKRTKSRLHVPKDKKIILYAPTFRDNEVGGKNKFSFHLEMDLKQMQEKLADDYILLLRMHVIVSSRITIDEGLADFVYDVSNYPDIQELYLISDILITDYSSVMFDYANTKNPIIFFTYDLKTYRDQMRGFYIDFEKEAPGPLVENTEQIIESINNMTDVKQQYKERYHAFYDKYCSLEDGKASERVIKEVMGRN